MLRDIVGKKTRSDGAARGAARAEAQELGRAEVRAGACDLSFFPKAPGSIFQAPRPFLPAASHGSSPAAHADMRAAGESPVLPLRTLKKQNEENQKCVPSQSGTITPCAGVARAIYRGSPVVFIGQLRGIYKGSPVVFIGACYL